MQEKHILIRIEQCLALAQASNCPRRKFGALLLDPKRNVVLMDGYNGGPRGGSRLCGGEVCLRDELGIPSGTRIEIGCHHAEMNVICNAAAAGVPCAGAWLIVTGEPCLLCAKLIHHAGITKVIVVQGGYKGENGIDYLKQNHVEVEWRSLPQNPKSLQESNVFKRSGSEIEDKSLPK
ncbi:MAG: deaminase [Sandaracinaceae bacterium]|nr:deaminase [Sandaracinaceae bacterium]MDW8246147.1 deaminase [Sandaracinaceae bacterium]